MKKPTKAPVPQPQHRPLKDVTPTKDTTTAFLQEVDAAMQQERLLAVWHRGKWFILSGVLALLLVVAGQQAWNAWRTHQARTTAEQWYAYMHLSADSSRQKELAKFLQNTGNGTYALAAYQLAAMQHTPAEKAKAYMQVANSNSAPEWLREIARLNAAVALTMDNPAQAKAELEVLAQTNLEKIPSPAYAPALELLALLAQQSGDINAARGYTTKLLQQGGLPADMRQRALQRLGTLGGLQG